MKSMKHTLIYWHNGMKPANFATKHTWYVDCVSSVMCTLQWWKL